MQAGQDDFERGIEQVRGGSRLRARRHFARAAEAGHSGAQVELGLWALHGFAGDCDAQAAREHFARAAQCGSAEAHYWLAVLNIEDDQAADAHLQRAIALGHRAALEVDALYGDSAAAPPTLRPDLVAPDLKLAVYDNVLSAAECVWLQHLAAPLLAPAKVASPQGGSDRLPLRSNDACCVGPERTHLILRKIEHKLSRLAGLPLRQAEYPALLRYQIGEEYRPHRDDLPGHDSSLRRHGQRKRTIFCYLNDVPAGGETNFLDVGIIVQPQRGRVVMFDNVADDGGILKQSRHASLPVLQGEKWLATLWFRERAFRDW